MEPRHERIARIALAAGGRYGLALVGGYAVAAHGIGGPAKRRRRPVHQRQHRAEFPELAWAVIAALEAAGYKASVIMSAETFARLTVTDPESGTEEKVELSVDWRAHDPVQLAVGPVLHADDAVASKVCALFGRALPSGGVSCSPLTSARPLTSRRALRSRTPTALWPVTKFTMQM